MTTHSGDEVTAALELATEEVEAAIAELKVAAKDAIDGDRLDEARRLTDQIDPIRKFVSRLDEVRREWLAIGSRRGRTRRPRDRAQRRRNLGRLEQGKATPNGAYRLPLLSVIAEHGGVVAARIALNELAERMTTTFTTYDYEPLPSSRNGELRWRKAAQWARYEMVLEGLLAGDSPRGSWAITDAGRAWLAERR